MPRPLWTDAGDDPHEVAAHLEKVAQEARVLHFDAAPLPAGTDRRVLHQAAMLRVRQQLSVRHSEKDRVLIQETKAIDELVRSANLLVERLREWYALHAPEATRHIEEARDLARLVADHGDRQAVMQALDLAGQASVGTDLDASDLAVVRSFAEALRAVQEAWAGIEARVEGLMDEIAPNLESVVGPVLGARLVAHAGGLERLATVPTGTLQTYGAETALFRHIKEGTKPPKHGILFQHPKVHAAPPWQRGAVARALAIHASLAAKADAFTQHDMRDHLEAGLSEDLARIARRKAKPPRRGGGTRAAGGRGPGGGKGGKAGPRGGRGGAGGKHRGKGGADRKRGGKGGEATGSRPPGAGGKGGPDGGKGGSGKGGSGSGPRDAGKRQRDPGAFRKGGPARPPGGGR